MIEIAEAKYISSQIELETKNKRITQVDIKRNPHQFAWFNHDDEYYKKHIDGAKILRVKQSGSMIRIILDSNIEIVFGEDIIFSYHDIKQDIGKNQMALFFEDGFVLEVRAKLYGFFLIGYQTDLETSNQYYRQSIHAIDLFDDSFTYAYFLKATKMNENKTSIKAALATDQHLPGVGNGTIQDILFYSGISPEHKVSMLTDEQKHTIYKVLVDKVKNMHASGGRDSVLDIYGRYGGYKVQMSNLRDVCPICSQTLIKKAYMGGKVIYCPECQK